MDRCLRHQGAESLDCLVPRGECSREDHLALGGGGMLNLRVDLIHLSGIAVSKGGAIANCLDSVMAFRGVELATVLHAMAAARSID